MTKNGIHHVPNDQKNKVNPFVNPRKSAYDPCVLGMVMHKIEPAKVVIARGRPCPNKGACIYTVSYERRISIFQ